VVVLAWCRYLLAAVFLMAALTKVTDLTGFADQLVLHGGLPERVGVSLAAFLPALELVCGLCLALGVLRREAALLAGVLLLVFSIYTLTRLTERDCGCFLFPVSAPNAGAAWALTRNAVLLLCSVGVCWSDRPPRVGARSSHGVFAQARQQPEEGQHGDTQGGQGGGQVEGPQ
jgi:uncharacterized membrane protein YphA (DoxX/SURF4 family)